MNCVFDVFTCILPVAALMQIDLSKFSTEAIMTGLITAAASVLTIFITGKYNLKQAKVETGKDLEGIYTEKLQNMFTIYQGEITELKDELKELKTKNEELNNSVLEQKIEISELKNTIEAQKQEIETLNQTNQDISQKYSDLLLKNEELLRSNEELSRQNSQLLANLETFQNNIGRNNSNSTTSHIDD